MNKVCRGPKAPCRILSRLSQDSLNLAFKHAAQGACCPACSRRAHSYATLPSQVLPSGRAGLKAFLTQFLDSYTIVCPACPVHTHGGGGGGLQISGYVCGGGGAEFLRLFLPLLGPQMGNLSFWRPPDDSFWVVYPPQWEICHSGVPQMTVSGCFTPPPPQDGKSVILGSPDDSFRVFYPPLMGNLSFWDPQMTVSGCSPPPPDGKSVILGSPDDSFWVFYPPP